MLVLTASTSSQQEKTNVFSYIKPRSSLQVRHYNKNLFYLPCIIEGPVVSTKDLDAEEDGDIKNINPYAHAVDDNLADVVLVSQEEIDKFKSEIKTLRLEVEDLHTRMEIAAE